jgi:hypothetical protein
VELSDLPWAPPGSVEVVEVLRCDASPERLERLVTQLEKPIEGGIAPVFVLSKGRARSDAAEEQLKKDCGLLFELNDADCALDHLVFVERDDVAPYRKQWPNLVLAVLPAGGRLHAYARAVMKRVTRRAGAVVRVLEPERSFQPNVKEFFMVDDNVGFRTVDGGATVSASDALNQLAVSARERQCAVAGFEKTSARAKAKKSAKDEDAFVFKCFYINAEAMSTRDVDFFAGLRCAEDIDFINRVARAGHKVAKVFEHVQLFCNVKRHNENKFPNAHVAELLVPWRLLTALQPWEGEALAEMQHWVTLLRLRPVEKNPKQPKKGFEKSIVALLLELNAVRLSYAQLTEGGGVAALLEQHGVLVREAARGVVVKIVEELCKCAREDAAGVSWQARIKALCEGCKAAMRDHPALCGLTLWNLFETLDVVDVFKNVHIVQLQGCGRNWQRALRDLRDAFGVPAHAAAGPKTVEVARRKEEEQTARQTAVRDAPNVTQFKKACKRLTPEGQSYVTVMGLPPNLKAAEFEHLKPVVRRLFLEELEVVEN